MFVGRDRELDQLQQAYDSGKFECIVVYGRRRIGKTTLINRFLEDKPNIFYSAIEATQQGNLAALSGAISAYRNHDGLDIHAPLYSDFSSAVESVFAMAADQRLVWVIDEYPFLAQADRSVSSVLQHAIDKHKDHSQLMIVLCGSSMSFMERQVLDYTSPLYGRRTGAIKLMPFTFDETRQFTSSLTRDHSAIAYGLTGGVAQYLEWLNPSDDISNVIENRMISPSCNLFDEPYMLLQQEVRKPAEYNEMIRNIATGSSRMSEIASASQMPTSQAQMYLTNMIDLGILDKEIPFGAKGRSKTIYRIKDSFFRFWYRYIPRSMSAIQARRLNLVTRMIMDDLPRFMGPVFEEISLQWIWGRGYDQLPFPVLQAGRWWGSDPKTRQREEIDIVATGENLDRAIFCECKWRNDLVGETELRTLQYRSQLLPYLDKHYILFSKTGFTDNLKQLVAEDNTVQLISFGDMA